MNDESGLSVLHSAATDASNVHLLKIGFEGLEGFLAKTNDLDSVLRDLSEMDDANTRKSAIALQKQLHALEPSVTMVGQVKSGKTSLVNAMVGYPNLLPADVNPWTSVVTSLHIDPSAPKSSNRAKFKFFDQDEWSRLIEKGGRMGELASRAGADEELEKVKQQVEEMREKSRARLGRRFELLLGQEHDYDSFDEELIKRYVCLGDDFGDEDHKTYTDGRFADITKSADLFMQRAEVPLKLCIRDTPGVNDTFMMREQITIRAIRDSRICVVVLSAHQALSTVDMALIRLISNIKSREVIIFVNRIDELSDPATQIDEIEQSIRETLRTHNGPADAQIIFGSAYWAGNALSATLNCLSHDSAQSLLNWAERTLRASKKIDSPQELVWKLSGIPSLYAALSERISEGIGQDAIEKIARCASNLAKGIEAASHRLASCPDGTPTFCMDKQTLLSELERIETRSLGKLEADFKNLISGYHSRLERSHKSFLERATASLVMHLEKYGEDVIWTYEPTGLRLLLRSAYQIFGTNTQKMTKDLFDSAARDISEIYKQAFGLEDNFEIEAPVPSRVPPPIVIGQTIALDIKGNWWRNWWQRKRGYQAYAANFNEMIMAETDPIVRDLKVTQVASVQNDATATLKQFLAEQRSTLLGFGEHDGSNPEDFDGIFGSPETEDRLNAMKNTIANLARDAA